MSAEPTRTTRTSLPFDTTRFRDETEGQATAQRWGIGVGLFLLASVALAAAWHFVAVETFGWPPLRLWQIVLVLAAWRLASWRR